MAEEGNTMHSLECGNLLIERTKNLLAHATHFYKGVIGHAPGSLFSVDPSWWSTNETLSSHDNADLTRPFYLEELSLPYFLWNLVRLHG